jgi:site-specific DNA-methyltransferase (adenine-specific)
MKPYFEDATTTLFNADFLKCPPAIGDVFVTDPPYARSGGASTGWTAAGERAMMLGGADQFWVYWFTDVARKLAQSCAKDACGFVFTDYRTVGLVDRAFAASGTGWVMSQCLVWDRDAIGLGSPFRASHELIAFCRSEGFKWEGRKDIRNVLRYRWPYGEHEHHPAEKPVSLLRYLVETVSAPGAVVLDPFAGSGSTLVAAKQAGRRAIGIEIEERHCGTAARRLAQNVLPLEAA